ncbi:diacylglycerol/lipid kinase family protein [Streptomyces physcomitrii]|uniref:YegS/Rv2252/BmrU family lipid kinase n=1 Tax=Streptomyces physcomitrii TaxID=2724184 RepID=A0ABX1H5F7_9ACTN|nr:YegS/Rv2252/BmrU family lipid kinase [Streptomyces physcomitrii]NKI43601.1 YegS/Rv2252/BmrU family lipid kinase [Streptomyces physcomitrii]
MTGHATLLVNPASAKGGSARVAGEAVRLLGAAGWRTTVISGEDAAQSLAAARAQVAEGTDVLAAVGGDGTVHLGTQAVAGTGVPLGVVPAGTGNDFARMLGIPRTDPAAATRLLMDGRRRTVDLARCGERWFATVLTSGFDALVSHRVNTLNWPRGKARYQLAIALEGLRLRPFPFRILLDGKSVEQEGILVAVGNTAYYGSGLKICPDAAVDDGLLEVTLLRAAGRRQLIGLLPLLKRGTHLGHPLVETYRAREVEIHAPEVFAYADGEFAGDLPLRITCAPGAATVLVPHEG